MNSPLPNADPMGLWVCHGSSTQCSSFSNGLQAVQSASTSGNLDPYQQATLANIVNAYGAEGDPNVQINFGSLRPGVKGSTGKNKSGCESITLDDSKLKDPGNNVNQLAATIAHEGQHVSDDNEWYIGFPVSTSDSEVNAYTAEAYYDKAMQYPEISGMGNIWTYSGGINYSAIQNRAAWSTSVDNSK